MSGARRSAYRIAGAAWSAYAFRPTADVRSFGEQINQGRTLMAAPG
jgi:hypothetical protein